jgi:hypothetical protein
MKKINHYFASHALGWATGDTRVEAVEKLAKMPGMGLKSWILNAHKEGSPGVYIWSCKVNAPSDEPYKIECFKPVGVEIEDGHEHFVTYLSAKAVGIYNKPKAESLAGLKEKAA